MSRKILLASPTEKGSNLLEYNERAAIRDDVYGLETSARLGNFESYTRQINQLTELMLREIDTKFQGDIEADEVPQVIGELEYYLSDQLPRVEQSIKYAIARISVLNRREDEGV